MAVIGIDLGTTNSLVCTWKEGKCVIIPNRFQKELTPSVVSVDEDGTFYTGEIAKERLIGHPDNSVCLFKRTMGTDQTYTLGKKEYRSEELSSFIIRQLVDDAQAYLKEEIEEAVISVPAYFNDAQRNATKRAGALAGIKVERLINEPSAAALYARGNMEDATFLVFDFGGGTLDISIVQCFHQVITILAVSGDNHLGGSDFDQVIADLFCEENKMVFEQLSFQNQQILLRQCEEMKIALSKEETVSSMISLADNTYSFSLSNHKLILAAPDIFERMMVPVHKAMHDAQICMGDLDRIILVGGSSKMPVVKNYLEMKLGCAIHNDIDPECVVAMGIGMYTGIKERSQDIKDIILADICPFTLGVGTYNESDPGNSYMSPIIERNSSLPSSKEHVFFTIMDNQEEVHFGIYQGESMYAKNNLKLGETRIEVKKGKKGEYPIKVRFTYDINGILDIDIVDTGSLNEVSLLITNQPSSMSEQEMETARAELAKLKIHPRENDRNKLVLSRLERLYEESIFEQREYIMSLNRQFEALLEKQNTLQIEHEREKLEAVLDELEKKLHPYTQVFH